MTETEQPAVVARCREREIFPWTAVARTELTIASYRVQAGEQVTVEAKQDGQFVVSVPRDGATREGRVAPGTIDEILCATIEDHLLDRANITWGNDDSFRLRVRARQSFQIREPDTELTAGTRVQVSQEVADSQAAEWEVTAPEGKVRVPAAKVRLMTHGEDGRLVFDGELTEAHTIPGASAPVVADEVIAGYQAPGNADVYYVTKSAVSGEVASTLVTPLLGLPSCTGQLGLMCYELAPYAAALAGLRPNFVAAANARSLGAGSGTTLEYWTGTLGVTYAEQQTARSGVSGLRLQRGDLVIFHASYPTHVMVATGDNQDVYSLWNRPANYPVRVDLGRLWDSEKTQPTRFVQTATPAWHTAA